MPSPLFEKHVLEEANSSRYPDLITRFRHRIPISNLSFLSMTSDKEIAKEFTGSRNVKDFDQGKSGYVHVLSLHINCRVYDMSKDYAGHKVSREREIVLLPGHVFKPVRAAGHYLYWEVCPTR